MLVSFIFGGRIPHPSFVLLILSIYIFVVSYKKKKKKILVGGCWETGDGTGGVVCLGLLGISLIGGYELMGPLL